MTAQCEPWCKRPPGVARDDIWVCPVCSMLWDREAMTERIIAWTQEFNPTLTPLQLSFLRAFLNDPNNTIKGNPNRGSL